MVCVASRLIRKRETNRECNLDSWLAMLGCEAEDSTGIQVTRLHLGARRRLGVSPARFSPLLLADSDDRDASRRHRGG